MQTHISSLEDDISGTKRAFAFIFSEMKLCLQALQKAINETLILLPHFFVPIVPNSCFCSEIVSYRKNELFGDILVHVGSRGVTPSQTMFHDIALASYRVAFIKKKLN